METTLENNIWFLGGGSLMFWSKNKKEYHEFNIYHNIFLVTENKLMGGGRWNDEPLDIDIDNNIYWHAINGDDGFLFRYKNIT